MARDFWLTAAGVVAGGVITLLASWYFYAQAAKELLLEAEKLRKQSNAIFGAVINPEASRLPLNDAQGNLAGVIVRAAGTASGSSRADGVSK
jgi:hypothetical protein